MFSRFSSLTPISWKFRLLIVKLISQTSFILNLKLLSNSKCISLLSIFVNSIFFDITVENIFILSGLISCVVVVINFSELLISFWTYLLLSDIKPRWFHRSFPKRFRYIMFKFSSGQILSCTTISFVPGFCHPSSAHQLIICAEINPYHHCSCDFIIKSNCPFVMLITWDTQFIPDTDNGHNAVSFIGVFPFTTFPRLSNTFKFACRFEFTWMTSFCVLISTIFAFAGLIVTGIFTVLIPEIDIEITSSQALRLGIK